MKTLTITVTENADQTMKVGLDINEDPKGTESESVMASYLCRGVRNAIGVLLAVGTSGPVGFGAGDDAEEQSRRDFRDQRAQEKIGEN